MEYFYFPFNPNPITPQKSANPNPVPEVERTVLYKTKLLDGIKPNTDPKTNRNPKLTLFSCFMLFFEHRPLIFSLALTPDP